MAERAARRDHMPAQPPKYAAGWLLANNDNELVDLIADSEEMKNLGADPRKNEDLVMGMNALRNLMIARQVGVNDGGLLPVALRKS